MKRLWIALFLMMGLMLISLVVGASSVGWEDLLAYWMNYNIDPSIKYIIMDLRIPRTMSLVSIGMSLGLCGVLLQTSLDNPLAEPYTLGLSGAAALGAVISLFFGSSTLGLSAGSLLGCMISTALILVFTKQKYLVKSKSLILAGIMISLFCGAIVTLLVSLLDPAKIQLAVYWMMGQVGTPRDVFWPLLFFLFFLIYCFFYFQDKNLDRLLLGEDIAKSLGTKTDILKITIIVCVCLLTAVSVSIAGLIGFVGLVAPHLAYLVLGTRRHRMTLTLAPLIGGILFLVSDILARVIGRQVELPSGSIMALIGAPILILLLVRGTKHVSHE